jgi:RNA polymerase sigma-70 factor (ECF subfamily)
MPRVQEDHPVNPLRNGSRDEAGATEMDFRERREVAASQRGDLKAFEALHRRHVGRVHALCLRMTADPELAGTLTQDVFVRAWRKLDSYRGEGPFGAWLRRLAVNVVIEDRRRAARTREREVQDPSGIMTDGGGARGAVMPAGRPEARIDLERAILTLPPGARQAFVLHDVNGYRHREIAEMTGLAVGTVKAQLHRARALLRRALEPAREVEDR